MTANGYNQCLGRVWNVEPTIVLRTGTRNNTRHGTQQKESSESVYVAAIVHETMFPK